MDKPKPLYTAPKLTEAQKQQRSVKNKNELDLLIQTEISKLLPERKYLSSFKI